MTKSDEHQTGLDLLLSIVGDSINDPEVIAEVDRINKLVASLEPCAVYELDEQHSLRFRVCVCRQQEDARDIALFFQRRDGNGYRYMWTDDRLCPLYAWVPAV